MIQKKRRGNSSMTSVQWGYVNLVARDLNCTDIDEVARKLGYADSDSMARAEGFSDIYEFITTPNTVARYLNIERRLSENV